MVRFTQDLMSNCAQNVNAAKLRQLTLRGQHLDVVENLGITNDQYEAIDFSENQIIKLTQMPPLDRLQSLIFSANAIARIADDTFINLPALNSVNLTKNKLRNLVDLNALGKIKKLERLTVRDNEVCNHEYYRQYLLWVLKDTAIRYLDFSFVTDTEKREAVETFEGPGGEALLKEIAPTRMEEAELKKAQVVTPEDLQIYKRLIESATDPAQVDKLQEMLNNGEKPPQDGSQFFPKQGMDVDG